MDAGSKFSRHNHARVECSVFWKNDTIEQLQMCMSAIAGCVRLCKASTMATFIGKMGVALGNVCNCTRKLYICEGLSPFANVFS